MADTDLPRPNDQVLDNFIRGQGLALRARDEPAASKPAWEERKAQLRAAMFAAMGPFPTEPCPLEPKEIGVLKRTGYRIDKLIFQSRPGVWVTASAYVPEPLAGKAPAVLVVHGHWAWARRDPVVQARCLGLVQLGYVVLAVDAFGAGERYTEPGRGTYHGALYGSTLWPVGQTLLGMQVYDNRRAVDYLRSRPEVDGDHLGITGASGGGNQSMYAGALDERFGAVVPVCSVGTYQAYLHAACCVCEVLPGAMRFTQEGDVLALVAPRALMVINASRDALQFSPGEAKKSLARAEKIFQLYDKEDKLRHMVFESAHDYSQPMREAMYGWMMRWLKDEGTGKPIAEPAHTIEKPEDLSCFPDQVRPKGFFFPPSFAGAEGRRLLARLNEHPPDHAEAWESRAVYVRAELRKQVLGDLPPTERPKARLGKPESDGKTRTTSLLVWPEPGLPLPALVKATSAPAGNQPACVLLHFDGKLEALKHPLAGALLDKGWVVVAPDLRGTGETRPASDNIHIAVDHNSAEHALWIGRPLLGQWMGDVQCLLDWLAAQPGLDGRRLAVVGVGHAGIVALCAAGLLEDRVTAVAALDTPVTYITDEPYGAKMRMGLLAPGLLRWADVPHLAALAAPRRLLIAGGITPQDKSLPANELKKAYAFPAHIYELYKAQAVMSVFPEPKVEAVAAALGR
jgi:dienelactone hydrolase